jgi:transcriptional regulator with XRE-family HTH domain
MGRPPKSIAKPPSYIVQWRKYHCMTQAQVAERLGITQSAYGRWESGETRVTQDGLAKLAAIYGHPVEALNHAPERASYVREILQLSEGLDPSEMEEALRHLRGLVARKPR